MSVITKLSRNRQVGGKTIVSATNTEGKPRNKTGGWWLEAAKEADENKAVTIRKIADAIEAHELGPGYGFVWLRFLYNIADDMEK